MPYGVATQSGSKPSGKRLKEQLVKAFSKLLPCPFCGGKKVTLWKSRPKGKIVWCVFCDGCEAEGPHSSESSEAVRLWNYRSIIASLPEPEEVMGRCNGCGKIKIIKHHYDQTWQFCDPCWKKLK